MPVRLCSHCKHFFIDKYGTPEYPSEFYTIVCKILSYHEFTIAFRRDECPHFEDDKNSWDMCKHLVWSEEESCLECCELKEKYPDSRKCPHFEDMHYFEIDSLPSESEYQESKEAEQ